MNASSKNSEILNISQFYFRFQNNSRK